MAQNSPFISVTLEHARKHPKVPGQFTSLAGEAVTADVEDTFADNVHIVRVFRCVRRPHIQYERIIELCENENEGSSLEANDKNPDHVQIIWIEKSGRGLSVLDPIKR